ncbi:hypothetical protein ACWDVV_42335, partial [Streptomyces tendae]
MTTANTQTHTHAPATAFATGTPTTAPPGGSGDSGRSLSERLTVLRDRVAALVEHRTADDPTADDPLRGLYLPDEAVHHLLRTWPSADAESMAAATA